ncbi:hypothetical protein [Massilia cavernae]|uniref:hypothetical protein n=1 Tax=Massilia cavernae TaxID=2320864 RepID=UPI001E4958F9|nr:hypothetical protein [Massilia cavernae]
MNHKLTPCDGRYSLTMRADAVAGNRIVGRLLARRRSPADDAEPAALVDRGC